MAVAERVSPPLVRETGDMSTVAVVRTQFPSALLVAGGLAAGFGVAQATGLRALGGAAFVAAGAGAAWLWWRRRGLGVVLGLGAAYVAAFVLAHVLALGVGLPAWLAVSLVTIFTAGLAYLVADRPTTVDDGRRRTPSA